jgi:hypothetical protein
MKHHGWRLAEAYKWVKDKRPNINLSAGGWCMGAWALVGSSGI